MELYDFNLHTFIYEKKGLLGNLQDLSEFSHHTQNFWGIMEQITCGTVFIHQCNLVHRDLKPANGMFLIMLLTYL